MMNNKKELLICYFIVSAEIINRRLNKKVDTLLVNTLKIISRLLNNDITNNNLITLDMLIYLKNFYVYVLFKYQNANDQLIFSNTLEIYYNNLISYDTNEALDDHFNNIDNNLFYQEFK